MRRIMIFSLVAGVVFQLIACQPARPTYTPVFVDRSCPVEVPSDFQVRCGTVSVPEDREKDNGRMVVLSVAVAESPNSQEDLSPVIMLAGGPGGVAMDSLPFLLNLFQSVIEERPVIFYDQRGVGHTEPALDCPEVGEVQDDILIQHFSDEEKTQMLFDAYAACKLRLEQEGVSLASYTTTASADDVKDIITALGYPQVYLFGGSYGTRLAQVILLRHQSEGWISGAVLDSVVPLQVEEGREFWPNTQATFKLIFSRCAENPKCNTRYPDLEDTFYLTMERLRNAPMEVGTFDPQTGKGVTVSMDDEDFFMLLFMLLYDSFETSKVPQIIGRVSEGDASAVQQPLQRVLGFSQSVFEGMGTSVQCVDEGLNTDLGAIQETNSFLDPVFQDLANGEAEEFQALCQMWGVQPVEPIQNRALETELPILILAGEQDPITPASWGGLLHDSIPTSYYYDFPGLSHGVFATSSGQAHPCVEEIILDFLNDSSQPPDGICVSTMTPLPFRVPRD